MTRDEILNMPAGPEMDALVAEKVIGWTLHPETHWDVTGVRAGMNWRQVCDFCPSTDISAAWEVVEKMLSDGWSVQIYSYSPGEDCVAELWRFPNEFVARADTAPLAISRAALLTVMGAE